MGVSVCVCVCVCVCRGGGVDFCRTLRQNKKTPKPPPAEFVLCLSTPERDLRMSFKSEVERTAWENELQVCECMCL